MTYWARVPYLDPAAGDHKIVWELNRHQHFLLLGAAFWLTGDARYRRGFVGHLEDWLHKNPPLAGTNWASMLELAFRAISWTWAAEFFAPGAEQDQSPWLVDLLAGLDRQLTHVADNLSTYFSPNTHLLGEALALYVVSLAFPELRRSRTRAALGREVLRRESERQVRGDGGHAELSTHYHRYSTDFYLLACMVARAAGDDAAASFECTAHRQAAYLRTIADDEGRLPTIGDDDGGRLFRFDATTPSDASSTLSIAAAVLSDPSLAVHPANADVFWALGERAHDVEVGTGVMRWPSHLLADSGYFVSRSPGGNHFVFDAGPHGFRNGGHAHSDALSVVLTVRSLPLLIDPGTATYTMDRAVRDRYRSAWMHNTIILDGRDPSQPAGPFHWFNRADARILVARVGHASDFAAGTVIGRGATHVRAVLALHGTGWLIVDRLAPRSSITADLWWHLHPMWNARAVAGGVALQSSSGVRSGLTFSRGDVLLTSDPEFAGVAFEYGQIDTGASVRLRDRGAAPFAIASFIPARQPTSGALRIRELHSLAAAEPGWTAVTYAIHDGTGLDVHVEISFPDDAEAQPGATWPQPCIRVGRAREMVACAE